MEEDDFWGPFHYFYISVPPPTALLMYNWQTVGCLMCTPWWFDTYLHCERISTIRLINTFIISHIYLFNFWWEHFKFSSHSKFQLYNMVLSAVVTILYIRSSNFIHLITKSLYPFTNSSYFYLHSETLAITFLFFVSMN